MIRVAIADSPPWAHTRSNPEIDRLNKINATLYQEKATAERQREELFQAAKQLKAQLDALSAENAQLRAQAPVHNAADDGVWFKKWKQMETLFARHFHPDGLPPDASVREKIFAEFWDKLKAIRNSK